MPKTSYTSRINAPKEDAGQKRKGGKYLPLFCGSVLVIYAAGGAAYCYHFLQDKMLNLLMPAFFLFCGILYAGLLQKYLRKFEKKVYPFGLLFTLFTSAGCLLIIYAAYYLLNMHPNPVLLSGMCLFPLPFLLFGSWNASAGVPVKEYERWIYPVNTEPPDERLLNTPKAYLIKLSIHIKKEDHKRVLLKMRAPQEMPLGKLIHLYIAKYNRENADNMIEYADQENRLYQWYFYTRKRLWSKKIYFSTSHTVDKNGIRQGTKVYAERY